MAPCGPHCSEQDAFVESLEQSIDKRSKEVQSYHHLIERGEWCDGHRRERIQELQALLQQDSDIVEKMIEKQERTLATLKSLHKTSRQSISQCGYLQSPIRLLPVEILYDIFDKVLADRSIHIGSWIRIPAQKLSSVCSRWRQQVLSAPIYWSDIVWALPSRYGEVIRQHRLPLFKLVLERSANYPLSLQVDIQDNILTTRVLSLLLPSCSRLRSLAIDFQSSNVDALARLISQFKGKLPNLERLQIRVSRADDLVNNQHISTFFDTPKLVHLQLATEFAVQLRLYLPWHQLTRLELQDLEPIQSLATIRETPSITELKIRATQPSIYVDQRSPTVESVSLPRIESLHLIFQHSPMHETWLWDNLVLPNLTNLHFEIEISRVIYDWTDWKIENLLARSGCTVMSLTFTQLILSPQPFLDALSAFRDHLLRLKLVETYEIDYDLSEDEDEDEDITLSQTMLKNLSALPRLKELTLCWGKDVTVVHAKRIVPILQSFVQDLESDDEQMASLSDCAIDDGSDSDSSQSSEQQPDEEGSDIASEDESVSDQSIRTDTSPSCLPEVFTFEMSIPRHPDEPDNFPYEELDDLKAAGINIVYLPSVQF